MSNQGKELDHQTEVAIVVLAGGLSRRFGRDKARYPLGRGTMLQLIRSTAQGTLWPVRVVRKDIVPRCGPLGGVITGFTRTRATLLLFLACDMPGLSESWMLQVIEKARQEKRPVFTRVDGRWGFPFALWRTNLETVKEHRQLKRFSLRDLAEALRALPMNAPRSHQRELSNINTREDWTRFRSTNLA